MPGDEQEAAPENKLTSEDLAEGFWLSKIVFHFSWGFPDGSGDKDSYLQCRDTGDVGLIPGSGKSPGGGSGNPLQYSCLQDLMDRGAWRATVHGVAKSQTCMSMNVMCFTSFTTGALLWCGHWNLGRQWNKDWYCLKRFLEKCGKQNRQKLWCIYVKLCRVCLPFHLCLHPWDSKNLLFVLSPLVMKTVRTKTSMMIHFHLMSSQSSSYCTVDRLICWICVSVFMWKSKDRTTRTV